MSVTILTQVKMKINLIRQLVTFPRFWGPLLTVGFTIVYDLAATWFGFSVAVFPLAGFLALGSLFGLWSGLICAAWITGYAWYAIPGDPARVIQIALGAAVMAVIIGTETRALRQALVEAHAARIEAEESAAAERAALERAERNEAAAQALEALNGNILRVKNARDLILRMLKQHHLDEPTRDEMRQVLHTLNNLELATAGWQALGKLKSDIDAARSQDDVHVP